MAVLQNVASSSWLTFKKRRCHGALRTSASRSTKPSFFSMHRIFSGKLLRQIDAAEPGKASGKSAQLSTKEEAHGTVVAVIADGAARSREITEQRAEVGRVLRAEILELQAGRQVIDLAAEHLIHRKERVRGVQMRARPQRFTKILCFQAVDPIGLCDLHDPGGGGADIFQLVGNAAGDGEDVPDVLAPGIEPGVRRDDRGGEHNDHT